MTARIRLFRNGISNERLFSDQAASFLAAEICDGQKTVDEVLKSYYVGPLTRLGLSVRAIAARSAGEHLRRMEGSRDNEWSMRYLQWMTESVLSDLTAHDAFCIRDQLVDSQRIGEAVREFSASAPLLRSESQEAWRPKNSGILVELADDCSRGRPALFVVAGARQHYLLLQHDPSEQQ